MKTLGRLTKEKEQEEAENPEPVLSPSLNIKELTKSVSFKGPPTPQNSWKKWVESLQITHQNTWRKAGIFDAIRVSTYSFKRDNELVLVMAERFWPETNTFVFSWGEATITLEDVMILGGFSVLGSSVVNPPYSKKVQQIEKKMVDALVVNRRGNTKQVSHEKWMEYFEGKGGVLEHVALLVFWLSRYVFCTTLDSKIPQCVLEIAINLALGTKIALAPAVLAALYGDLRLLKQKIVAFSCDGEHHGPKTPDLVVWGLFQLVQVWAWERFPGLSPEPASLARGEPRVARWRNVNVLIEGLRQGIESVVDNFCWKPYALNVNNWEFPKFYSDREMWVLLDSKVDEQLESFARCLRPCELVGVDSVEQYLPHRVKRQFGFDQDVPNFIPKLNVDAEVAWSFYSKPLDGLNLQLLPRLYEGGVTEQYSNWWNKLWERSRSIRLKKQVSKMEKRKSAREGEKPKDRKSSHGREKRKRGEEKHRDEHEKKYMKRMVVSSMSRGSNGKDLDVGFAEGRAELRNEKSFCETENILCQITVDGTDEIGSVDEFDLVMGSLEDNCRENLEQKCTEEDENEVNAGYNVNMNEGSKCSEGPKTKTEYCCAPVEGDATEDSNPKETNASINHVILSRDEKKVDVCDPSKEAIDVNKDNGKDVQGSNKNMLNDGSMCSEGRPQSNTLSCTSAEAEQDRQEANTKPTNISVDGLMMVSDAENDSRAAFYGKLDAKIYELRRVVSAIRAAFGSSGR